MMKTASEGSFRSEARSLLFDVRGRPKTDIALDDFEALQRKFSSIPKLGEFLVKFGSEGGEEGVEVRGLGDNSAEVWEIDRFHGRLHHILGIVGRDIDRRDTSCVQTS
ncbi:MAG: hypothetical protein KGI04_00040 [Candidatus Micrarchaeota archaeon]|nr:hypothetical protein [Candidatus Micrarchaeota archaeon]